MSHSKTSSEEDLLNLRDSVLSLRESHLERMKGFDEGLLREVLSRLIH